MKLPRCILFLAVADLLSAQAQREDAQISDFDDQSTDYEIVRAGKLKQDAQFTLPLSAGDRVIVHRGKKPIVVTLNNSVRAADREGHDVVVCDEDMKPNGANRVCQKPSPYTVPRAQGPDPGPAPAPSLWTRVFASFLTKEHNAIKRMEVPRGGLKLRVLATDYERVMGGRRTFQIEWEGGATPCSVTLYREVLRNGVSLEEVFSRTAVDQRMIRVENIELQPDIAHRVKINCGGDGEPATERVFFVSSPKDAPKVPPLAVDGVPSDLKKVIDVAWFAANTGWIWEAYLQLADIPAGFGPADTLRASLALGHAPPKE